MVVCADSLASLDLKLHYVQSLKLGKKKFIAPTCNVCIYRYTREAGVRALERKFGAICRAVAVKVAEGHRGTEEEDLKSGQGTRQGGRRLTLGSSVFHLQCTLRGIMEG